MGIISVRLGKLIPTIRVKFSKTLFPLTYLNKIVGDGGDL